MWLLEPKQESDLCFPCHLRSYIVVRDGPQLQDPGVQYVSRGDIVEIYNNEEGNKISTALTGY